MFCVTETADTGTSSQPPLLLLSLYTPREGRGRLFFTPLRTLRQDDSV